MYAYQALVKIGINLCFYILWITHSWRQTWPHATANSIRLLTVILPGFGAYFSACQAHKTNGKQFASFIFPSLTFLVVKRRRRSSFEPQPMMTRRFSFPSGFQVKLQVFAPSRFFFSSLCSERSSRFLFYLNSTCLLHSSHFRDLNFYRLTKNFGITQYLFLYPNPR